MSTTALRGQDSVKPHSSVVNVISLLGAFYPGCITLADAKAEDNPLVYVNRGFTVATGYSWAEIRGRNCRFLHEGHNNQPALAVVRHALANRRDICIDVINVTKGGKQFINRLLLLHLLEDYVLGLQHIVPRQHFSLSGNGSTSLIEPNKIIGQVKHPLTSSLCKLMNDSPSNDQRIDRDLIKEGCSQLLEIARFVLQF